MKKEHTRGPWRVAEGRIVDSATIYHGEPGSGIVSHVARVHASWICPEHGGNVEANARLIAAAPDLLDALKEAADYIATTIGHRGGDIMEAADAAISKAGG